MDIAATILAVLLAALYLLHGFMILSGHEMQQQNATIIGWPYQR